MSRNSRFVLLGCSALAGSIAIAVPPKVEQKVTGPVATYWVSAATSTGMTAGMMGGGGRPAMGDIMRMMRGGGAQAQRSLTLQLGSTQKVADPAADHLPGTLPPLPLVTPKIAPAAPAPAETVEDQPTMTKRPRGRMLLFWGCGEHAGPGQPYVIDFSKIGPGQPMPHFPFVPVRHQNPPSAGRYATYGEWPNARSSATVRGSPAPSGSQLAPPSRLRNTPISVPMYRTPAKSGSIARSFTGTSGRLPVTLVQLPPAFVVL